MKSVEQKNGNFLDTPSLVKLYYKEADSEFFIDKIAEKASVIYLSELSKVEFTSALWKKVRTGDIDQSTCESVLALFDKDQENYNWISFDTLIIETAKGLFKKYGLTSLRALDALQLSAALKMRNEVEVFITDDAFLRELFEKEGLETTL